MASHRTYRSAPGEAERRRPLSPPLSLRGEALRASRSYRGASSDKRRKLVPIAGLDCWIGMTGALRDGRVECNVSHGEGAHTIEAVTGGVLVVHRGSGHLGQQAG